MAVRAGRKEEKGYQKVRADKSKRKMTEEKRQGDDGRESNSSRGANGNRGERQ